MKVEYINPFVDSVNALFQTMLSSKATRGTVSVCDGSGQPRNIIALIGISGAVRGTVALHLPIDTALRMVGRMLDQEVHIMDQTVADGVAELVNIIAGGAKAKFPKADDEPLQLSLPTLVRGTSFRVEYPSKAVWLEVPFTSDLGAFSLRVTFEVGASKKGA